MKRLQGLMMAVIPHTSSVMSDAWSLANPCKSSVFPDWVTEAFHPVGRIATP